MGEPPETSITNAIDACIEYFKKMLDLEATSAGVETHFPIDEVLLKVLLAGRTSLIYNEIEKGVSCLLWRNFNNLQSSREYNLEIYKREEIVEKTSKSLALALVFQNREAHMTAHNKVHDNQLGLSPCQDKQEDFIGSNMTYIEREPVVLILDENSQVLP